MTTDDKTPNATTSAPRRREFAPRLFHMICRRCGYDLYGSRSADCPECGTRHRAYPPIYTPPVWMRVRRAVRRPARYGLYGLLATAGRIGLIGAVIGVFAFTLSLIVRHPLITSIAPWTEALTKVGVVLAARDAVLAAAGAILVQSIWQSRREILRRLPSGRTVGFVTAGLAAIALVIMMTIASIAVNRLAARRPPGTVIPATTIVPATVPGNAPNPPAGWSARLPAAKSADPSVDFPALAQLDAPLDFSVFTRPDAPPFAFAPEESVSVHTWDKKNETVGEAIHIVRGWLDAGDMIDAKNAWWHSAVPIPDRERLPRLDGYELLDAEAVQIYDGDVVVDRRAIVSARLSTIGGMLKQTREVQIFLEDESDGDLRISRVADAPETP